MRGRPAPVAAGLRIAAVALAWIGASVCPAAGRAAQTSGSIAGVVVSASMPSPGATVTLVPVDEGPHADSTARRETWTDLDGRFAFDGVTPGRYRVRASKPAFLDAEFGAVQPDTPGLPIAVGPGADVRDVTIALHRGAVIAGTLLSFDGTAAANVEVQIAGPTRRQVTTDDQGHFRAFGLLPGAYTVVAQPRSTSRGTVSGTFGPLDVVSAPLTYAPVYYPGTIDQAAAQVIEVEPDEERTNASFALVLAGTGAIAGQVTGLDSGAVLVGGGVLAYGAAPNERGRDAIRAVGRVQPDGRFEMRGLPPGWYELRVVSAVADRKQGSVVPNLWAADSIFVSPDSTTTVTLPLQPALALRGTVAVDETPGPRLGGISIALTPLDHPRWMPSPPRAITMPDGRFHLDGVLPGRYDITAVREDISAAGWRLISAVAGEVDVLDVHLDLTRPFASLPPVTMTLSRRPAALSGTILGSDGTPDLTYTVAAYPADRRLWGVAARRHVLSRAASDGAYVFPALPPGLYRVAAVSNIDVDTWTAQANLEAMDRLAVTVDVPLGAAVVLNLRAAQ